MGYHIYMTKKCSNCNNTIQRRQSHLKRFVRSFCNRNCYSKFRKTKLPFEEQHAYKGVLKKGQPRWLYSARYRKSHPERISHLKARRYARERNAEGSHTLEEWKELCKKWGDKCRLCLKKKKLTKDHIKPLSLGGTDYIKNIQPLCRNCNSRKWKKFYENPNLLPTTPPVNREDNK